MHMSRTDQPVVWIAGVARVPTKPTTHDDESELQVLTNEQRILLLTQAGVKVDDAQEVILGAAPDVIEEQPDEVVTPVKASVTEGDVDLDATLKRIVAKSFADQKKALSLCDAEGKTFFDWHKVSKVQAAAHGLNKTVHNKRAWDESQKITMTLKRMVRDHYRVTSMKAKIAASKVALPQEVRDLDDSTLERLLASEEFLALLNRGQS
jgi:hypothetical protein